MYKVYIQNKKVYIKYEFLLKYGTNLQKNTKVRWLTCSEFA